MEIRPAEHRDLEELSLIETAAYHPELVTPLEEYGRILRERVIDDFLEVACADGRILGFCHFSMNRNESGECGIWDIAVAKRDRGTGVGKALLEHIIFKARSAHMEHILLHVPEDYPVARGLYESKGFVTVGRISRYYPPQGAVAGEFTVDALVMTLLL